jgi:hypothetical protein
MTFKCTQCRAAPAVVKKGRKTFLCARCATDLMWHDIVGGVSDAFVEDETPEVGSV